MNGLEPHPGAPQLSQRRHRPGEIEPELRRRTRKLRVELLARAHPDTATPVEPPGQRQQRGQHPEQAQETQQPDHHTAGQRVAGPPAGVDISRTR